MSTDTNQSSFEQIILSLLIVIFTLIKVVVFDFIMV